MELAPLYVPHGVEDRWQRIWEEERLYHADPEQSGETYVIAVPPPNVTGALHMGHALNGSIQDALIRWHRMRGFNTLWQPGDDPPGRARGVSSSAARRSWSVCGSGCTSTAA